MPRRTDAEVARSLATKAKVLRAQHQVIWQDLQREHDRSRVLIEQSQALIARLPCAPEAEAATRRHESRVWKRNKLFYKHRWLISVNVVAALRRAGVDCNIVVPPVLATGEGVITVEAPATTRATPADRTLH